LLHQSLKASKQARFWTSVSTVNSEGLLEEGEEEASSIRTWGEEEGKDGFSLKKEHTFKA